MEVVKNFFETGLAEQIFSFETMAMVLCVTVFLWVGSVVLDVVIYMLKGTAFARRCAFLAKCVCACLLFAFTFMPFLAIESVRHSRRAVKRAAKSAAFVARM